MTTEEIDLYDTLSMVLLAGEDKSIGRTVLQKLIYFCCNSTANIENVGFKPYYYGPYSANLSAVLEQMVSCGFAEQKLRQESPYESYNYKLTKRGENLANDAKKLHGKDYDKIHNIIDTCYDKTGLQAVKISYAAKIHYIRNVHKADLPDKISRYAEGYGWIMDVPLINKYMPLAKELDINCKNNTSTS